MLYVYRILAAVVLNILQNKQEKKKVKLEEKSQWLKLLSHLRAENQIRSGCKLCCRYVENIVDLSVQIKTLKTLKFFNYGRESSLLALPSLSIGCVCVTWV